MKTRIKAYAKINLHLDVTGIRDDGYHNICSIMQSVSLCDIIDIEIIDEQKIVIECDTAGVPLDEKNIAYRAAARFFERAGLKCGASIKIKKNIPMAAGLAGGSADGAAVLVGLNEIFKGALNDSELYLIGSSLGADVPFCMACGRRLTEGIGDVMTRLDSISPETILVIACGGEGVSTPVAYGMLDEKYDSFVDYEPRSIDVIKESIDLLKNDDYKSLFNIFEEPISSVRGAVSIAKELMLGNGAKAAMMSGSGPSVFGIFEDVSAAERAVEALKTQGFFACVAYPTKER